MSNPIAATLARLFERDQHRIVFWYASEPGQRERYEAVQTEESMRGVRFLELDGNAFTLKRELMRVGQDERVVVFSPRARPEPHDNWLLDLELANYVFQADEGSIIATELGVDFALLDTIRAHQPYFNSKARKKRLADLLAEHPATSATELRMAMLGAELQVAPTLDDVTLGLLQAYSADPEEKQTSYATMERAGLDKFYWSSVRAAYGYPPDGQEPDVLGLAVFMCFGESETVLKDESTPLSRGAKLLMKRWKDSETYRPAYVELSRYVEENWQAALEQQLKSTSLEKLATLDTYRLVDLRVLHELIQRLESGGHAIASLRDVIEQRRHSLWYKHDDRIRNYYLAVRAALDFQEALAEVAYTASTPQQALDAYVQRHCRVDEAYLRFYQFFAASDSDSALKSLSGLVERRYVNEFLPKLNEAWQDLLDASEGGPLGALAALKVDHQRAFYETHVRPSVSADQDLFVIISDGLPYGSATRLVTQLEAAKRGVELSAGLAVVPSYTQLGMAALLPHATLEMVLPGANVLADGEPTSGTKNRGRRLEAKLPGAAVALTASDFIEQCTPTSKGREWKENYKVFYIYSNHVDAAGEGNASHLPEATTAAFKEIETVLAKISSINGTRAVITSDHGYLAQMSPLPPTSFLEAGSVEGDEEKSTRRFAVGTHLAATKGLMSFSASQLGLAGDYDVAIPKNILRFRKRGNDGRYAHGGMSLQELVTPVLQVRLRSPKRKHAAAVELRVTSMPSRVTTGQTMVTIYQAEAVGGKRLPARVTAGFFAEDGTALTALQGLTFDSTSTEPREREQRIGFLFNREASNFMGQTVYFRLYGLLKPGTKVASTAIPVLTLPVQMHVAFTSDFDL